MPPVDRSTTRNTFIYDSDNYDTLLGGLWATPSITNANLHSMLEIICRFSDTFELRDENGEFVERDEEELQPGNYYIATNGSITLTEEVPLRHTASMQSGIRVASFCQAVRRRDERCVISGRPVRLGRWFGFEAAHIFPLAYEEHWNNYGYGNLITIPPARESDGSINSVQNGILLSCEMHCFFDNYQVAINPNDNYKIVCFGPDPLFFHPPTRLDPMLLENVGWPPDALLSWHFEQAVLTNMKGAGEACFETDFQPGSGGIGEMVRGSMAAARMEFELLTLLNAIESCG